tara:strand:- start:24004 stop:25533 length:1530 start_codon:yes stop_codon:yes gene_type:complete
MAIRRYWATKDNTITNAYETNLTTRATGSNMGAADILETFRIYGQKTSGTGEAANESMRFLIQFPVTGSEVYAEGMRSIKQDRVLGKIPASGSVNFYLKLYNAPHSQTTPRNLKLVAAILNRDWEEGEGLDMDNFTDTNDGRPGSDWISASYGTTWTTPGGDWDYDDSSGVTASFDRGVEDMEVNVTPLVEKWIAGTKNNYGVIVRLDPQLSDTSNFRSYYTKKFWGRTSEHFIYRPVIEARWDSAVKDDRGNFYYSSSLATESDNLNTLYFYNFVRGRLRSIPLDADQQVVVALYEATGATNPFLLAKGGNVAAAGNVYATASQTSTTGIYSVSLSMTGSTTAHSTIKDVWHIEDTTSETTTQFFTGSIIPRSADSSIMSNNINYVLAVPNLKKKYHRTDEDRIRLYAREKDWSPTIYTRANNTIENTIIHSASYRITRDADDFEIIPFGTGSDMHTLMSHDVSGNYCDIDFRMLEAGFSYTLDFSFYDQAISAWVVQPNKFRFRIEE